jgi:hypothetical protein
MRVESDGHACAQGAVHPTPVGDFQKPPALGRVQVAYQLDGPVNGIDPLEDDFAARGLLRIRPVVAEPDAGINQGYLLPLRIHAECDRRSCTQRGQKERIGTRAPVCNAMFLGPVSSQHVLVGLDHLSIALTCHGMNSDI